MLDRDKYPLVEMPKCDEPREQSKGKDDKKWKAISAEGKLFASGRVCLSHWRMGHASGYDFCPLYLVADKSLKQAGSF